MDVFDAIVKRRSIRKYKKDAIEDKKLIRFLEAARLAPSADNRQPWHFIVITDPKARENLRLSYDEDWFISAPIIIVACADPKEAWVRRDGEEYWKVDVSIAMQNLILTATEEGLGTCWIGDFNEKAAKDTLGIPRDIRVVAMTPLGYPAEEKGFLARARALKSRVSKRKKLSQIIHYNHW